MGASWSSIMGWASSSRPSNEPAQHLAEGAGDEDRLQRRDAPDLGLGEDGEQDGADHADRERRDAQEPPERIELARLEKAQDDGAAGRVDGDHDRDQRELE